MVHNVNGVTKLLNTKEVYLEHTPKNKYSEMVKLMEDKTIYELLQIATKDKNHYHRIFAVHLLGKKSEKRDEIVNVLREVVTYEHYSVRNEAIWALARLGDLNISITY